MQRFGGRRFEALSCTGLKGRNLLKATEKETYVGEMEVAWTVVEVTLIKVVGEMSYTSMKEKSR